MTIQKLIDGEHVSCLQVNILKELSATQYIVGDTTQIAIMTTDESSAKFVEVGKGLRMVKPLYCWRRKKYKQMPKPKSLFCTKTRRGS